MNSALILGRTNGVGLDRDASLLAAALAESGVSAKCPKIRSLRALLSKGFRADAAFHLERVAPIWKYNAGTHFLIPNQERFPRRLLGRLRMIDHILCKSLHAVEAFSEHHPSVHFIGFTSEDRRDDAVEPDYGRFLHLAGRSTLKNTGLLLQLWKRHPEWPALTLVQHPDNAPSSVPENVELVSRYLPDAELRHLQNSCGIHLCPSLSEGWGHYLAEAMSCAAVTVATDAPPMNELVVPGRGVLVPFHRSEPRHLGMNFHADPGALEATIGNLIAMPTSGKRELGLAGRKWFGENDSAFAGRLAHFL